MLITKPVLFILCGHFDLYESDDCSLQLAPSRGVFRCKGGMFKVTQTVQYHLTVVDDDNLYAVQWVHRHSCAERRSARRVSEFVKHTNVSTVRGLSNAVIWLDLANAYGLMSTCTKLFQQQYSDILRSLHFTCRTVGHQSKDESRRYTTPYSAIMDDLCVP